MVDHVRRLVLYGLLGAGASTVLPPLLSSKAHAADEPLLIELRRRAARLANYGSFGANEELVSAIMDDGWQAWVEQQLALTPTPLFPSATLTTDKPTENQLYSAWWTNALVAPDQLHQRVGFALSQWFVISSNHPFLRGRDWTTIDYYDMLLEGVNGSFSDLLFQVSTHPAMCAFLSSLYNAKADPDQGTIPDENYARELMQLFTCGAERRNRNGNFTQDSQGERVANYTETDVQELARVFTGIGIAGAAGWGKETGDWLSPVVEYSQYHDSARKNLMGSVIPADLGLLGDIRAALDIILEKKALSVAGNFSRFMIQRLTVSNPKYSYVRDTANAFINSNWDIQTLVRTIMLHPDAVDGRSDPRCETGRLKEPLLWYASARRAIAIPRDLALAPLSGPLFNNSELRTAQVFPGQAPLGAPSVFGFFPREFQSDAIHGEGTPHINYTYPEAYLYNWSTVIRVSNKLWGNFIKKDVDIPRFRTLIDSGVTDEEFIDFVLDKILFGNFRPALRDELITLLGTHGSNKTNQKLRDALVLVLHSPDFLTNNLYQEA